MTTTTDELDGAQADALAWMSDANVGALLTRRGWTWRDDVRRDEDAAEAILEALEPCHCDINADDCQPCSGTGFRVSALSGRFA